MTKIKIEYRSYTSSDLEEYLNKLEESGWRVVAVNICGDKPMPQVSHYVHTYQIIMRKKKTYD